MNQITYLQHQIEDLEEKQAFHDNCGRHCKTCAELSQMINTLRRDLAEVEAMEQDFTSSIAEDYE
jgi:hypothetical protein